jgi:hypothetical protein
MSTLRCSRALGAAWQRIWQATMLLLAQLRRAAQSPARHADIFIPNYAATRATCQYFAVTHTQQPSILDRASVCVPEPRRSGTRWRSKTGSLVLRARRLGSCWPPWWSRFSIPRGESRRRRFSSSQRHVRTKRARQVWRLEPTFVGACQSLCSGSTPAFSSPEWNLSPRPLGSLCLSRRTGVQVPPSDDTHVGSHVQLVRPTCRGF